jgi:hypothetical protein
MRTGRPGGQGDVNWELGERGEGASACRSSWRRADAETSATPSAAVRPNASRCPSGVEASRAANDHERLQAFLHAVRRADALFRRSPGPRARPDVRKPDRPAARSATPPYFVPVPVYVLSEPPRHAGPEFFCLNPRKSFCCQTAYCVIMQVSKHPAARHAPLPGARGKCSLRSTQDACAQLFFFFFFFFFFKTLIPPPRSPAALIPRFRVVDTRRFHPRACRGASARDHQRPLPQS